MTDLVFTAILGAASFVAGFVGALTGLGGAAVHLIRHGHEQPMYHAFRGEPGDLRSIRGVLADTAASAASFSPGCSC